MKLIVAMSENNVIGINNGIPWHLSEDLKFFKEKTKDSIVIMGRKTYESIGKLLSDRINVILSRELGTEGSDVLVFNNIHSIDEFVHDYDKDVYVIGGAEVYALFLENDMIDEMFITKVGVHITIGDNIRKFPHINENDWKINKIKDCFDEKNKINFSFWNYKKSKI